MGHTKPEMLADLARELDAIRGFEGIKERSPGVFYYKAIAFLHFHDKDGSRWGDVKTPGGYQEVKIEFHADAAARRRFLDAVRNAHALLAARGVMRKKSGAKGRST
jgi:hypothetical protein